MKHDQELSRKKRDFAEQDFEFGPSYNGWRPHNSTWFGPQTANERYMYSYGNSVHMNPNSRESQEERARVENEMKFGEEVRKREEQEMREAKQRVEDELLKEVRRRMAMRARVIRDEQLMAEGTSMDDYSQSSGYGEKARPANFPYYSDDGESGYRDEDEFDKGDEYAEKGGPYKYHDCSEYNKEPAEGENVEEDLLNFKQSEYEGKDKAKGGEYDDQEYSEGKELDEAFSDRSTQRATTEYYNPIYRDEDNSNPFDITTNSNKHSDSQYETGKEEHSEEDDAPYYSFSERTQSVIVEDTIPSPGQDEHTPAEDNYIRVDADLHSRLAPFLPLFEAKLNHPSGLYTRADMHSELRGIVMETFCGWLENLRQGFSEAEGSDLRDVSENCHHLGYWNKEFARDECEVCHRWKPIFTLSCPGCGLKACVVCKFRC